MIKDVQDYYDSFPELEEERLNGPYSNIEFETTKYLIDKYLKDKGKTLDIGCGTGNYSIELLKKGYPVTLLDLSMGELNIAKRKIDQLNLKADDIICQSATELEGFKDESFDNILVMGPLYHLHSEKDSKDIYKNYIEMAKQTCEAPEYRDATEHLHILVERGV